MIIRLILTLIALIMFWPLGVVLGLYFLMRHMTQLKKGTLKEHKSFKLS